MPGCRGDETERAEPERDRARKRRQHREDARRPEHAEERAADQPVDDGHDGEGCRQRRHGRAGDLRAGDQDLRELAAARRRERVHRHAGGVRAGHREHGDLPTRVRRDEHASPGERPKRERPELEDERRHEEAPVEPAEAIGCGLDDVDDATRRRSSEALGPLRPHRHGSVDAARPDRLAANPSRQGSTLPRVMPIQPSMRRAILTAFLLAALAVPAGARRVAADRPRREGRHAPRQRARPGARRLSREGEAVDGARLGRDQRAASGPGPGPGRLPRRLLGRLGHVPQDALRRASSTRAGSTPARSSPGS